MNDQAETLRRLMEEPETTDTKVISIVSGKGGVGKSNFSLNFAIALSNAGKQVVLFDLDIGMANVDILMGMTSRYNIVDMIENEMSIWDIIEKGPGNVSFISGGSGFSTLFKLTPEKYERFVSQLQHLHQKFDYILFDMGAGASEDSLKFILSANEIVVVTTPEPTSITDAYSMIKFIHLHDNYLPCTLLINRAESPKEGQQTADNLQKVTQQFLGKQLGVLGSIPNDKVVMKAVKNQKPFLLYEPASKPAQAITNIVHEYIGNQQPQKQQLFSSFVSKLRRFLP
ncbi:MinD/ParA family protein [Bacillus alkalicellulosilyticus]|uniref:MinD/ParA family protein n=1 Tax=Alkalihalobacterium alkalicellulosilyticum TaxID=1912214 RepID=UPI000997DC75|nr:MinD/ParA family protein [Bacillus alkalicellulosilyticus]